MFCEELSVTKLCGAATLSQLSEYQIDANKVRVGIERSFLKRAVDQMWVSRIRPLSEPVVETQIIE